LVVQPVVEVDLAAAALQLATVAVFTENGAASAWTTMLPKLQEGLRTALKMTALVVTAKAGSGGHLAGRNQQIIRRLGMLVFEQSTKMHLRVQDRCRGLLGAFT